MRIPHFFTIAVIFFAGLVEAGDYQSHDSIREIVRSYIQAQSTGMEKPPVVTVSPLDNRLRLKQCDQPLEAFTLPNARLSGNLTVGVRCTSPKPWKLYVRARVQTFGNIVASSHPLNRGAVVTREDIKLVEHDTSMLSPGYITEPDKIVGKLMKQSVAADMVLKQSMVSAPKLIKRGEQVTILAEGKGLQVRMAGKALMDGAKGEVITVKNNSSKRDIEVEVIGAGLARVRM